MRLSFSTRGWRDLPWQEQIRDASELRFQGIEVYNLHNCALLTERGGAFHRFRQNETSRELREHNLEIPCLDTSIDLGSPDTDLVPTEYLIETAAAMRIPYVAFCALEDDEELIRRRISDLISLASGRSVCILIKTVGIYANTERLRRIMRSTEISILRNFMIIF